MNRAVYPVFAISAGALGLLHGCAASMAPPDPVARQATAGDWALEDRSEGGARTVGMTRSTAGFTLQYRSYYATNGAHWRTTTLLGNGCRGWTNGTHTATYTVLRSETRSIMETHLAGCPLSRQQIEAVLQGFEPAFAATWKWDREAAAWARRSAAALAKGPPALNMAQTMDAAANATDQGPR